MRRNCFDNCRILCVYLIAKMKQKVEKIVINSAIPEIIRVEFYQKFIVKKSGDQMTLKMDKVRKSYSNGVSA